ncbi:hypothetical protein [Flammeovirga kamogawensis]|uniref:Uncharacterized protein n=1 Tax=Flammeovirga kamogawensis TaxID=373891 RepID=A0ABX8GUN2_9BACT|nr:hypothetical protein [Flammeovirga kamogawensis]MBB6459919.1 hypothetical protein [Flammeovirga kamogawensis]QWG07028.1 hypothetical protein KM029_17260 [Flammeovirga kamogawensis]TRX68849.1 hypothetical protein EO216_12245 [Flammeovirga kamogawensis]
MDENSKNSSTKLLIIIGSVFGGILLVTTIAFFIFSGDEELDPKLVTVDEYIKENSVWELNGDAVEGSAVAITLRLPNMNLNQVEDAVERADQNVRQVDADIKSIMQSLGDDTSDLEASLMSLQEELNNMTDIYKHTEVISDNISQSDATGQSRAVKSALTRLLSTRDGYIRDINVMQENIDKVLTVLEDARNSRVTMGGVSSAIEELEVANTRLFEEGRSLLRTLFAFEYIYNQHRKTEVDGKTIDVFYIALQDYLYDEIIVNHSEKDFFRKKGQFDQVVSETKERLGNFDEVVALQQKREMKLSEYNKLSEHLGTLNELYAGAGLSITSDGFNNVEFVTDEDWEYSVSEENSKTPLVIVYRVEGTPLSSGLVVAKASYNLSFNDDEDEELLLNSRIENEVSAQ